VIALAATPSAGLDRDTPADLGERVVRQLRNVEPVHDQRRVRQAFTDGGLEYGAHVDRHYAYRVAPLSALSLDPG
jgi:hypothetical protein